MSTTAENNYAAIFDVEVYFYRVPEGVEFLRNGSVYHKMNKREADKVNWPSAGNIIEVGPFEIVRVSKMDVPWSVAQWDRSEPRYGSDPDPNKGVQAEV